MKPSASLFSSKQQRIDAAIDRLRAELHDILREESDETVHLNLNLLEVEIPDETSHEAPIRLDLSTL